MISIFLLVLLLTTTSVNGGFIDNDTPLDKRTTTSFVDGTTYHLVMSDEFNVPNRTFKDGHDPVWTALDKSDDDSSESGNGALQFYNSSAVTIEDGKLKIHATIHKTEWDRYDKIFKKWKHEKTYFRSGMVQSWEKFCFTGGILEVDVQFPGDPNIGGLWPAVWMLGNLGRATYEASTNNIWPWSYDVCNRTLQPAQAISACNAQNHYGLNPYQGRGATEIDLIEVMTGNSNGPLPAFDPPIALPYADLTLQVAPGVTENRPANGHMPLRKNAITPNGHTELLAQTWYDNMPMMGNTSLNPYFYGTYLGETKKGEPVTRLKSQAFQADAVGVAHQLTAAHFNKMHTFRIEWQPGPGGRLDWFTQGYKLNETTAMEGDGHGKDWVHAFSIEDKNLKAVMGAQIPNEPSYLIMNLAISSTWGFPYDTPTWCNKCYDCDDPKCTCAFHPGFCQMLREGRVSMFIDSIRVYQSRNHSAHVGNNHTLGCDPVEYPTREWIKGHAYRYMRNPPFVYDDIQPLRKVQQGGGSCTTDEDCGSLIVNENVPQLDKETNETTLTTTIGRGKCISQTDFRGMFSTSSAQDRICSCFEGYTGPNCLAQDHIDESVSAYSLRFAKSPFLRIDHLKITAFMIVAMCILIPMVLGMLIVQVMHKKRVREMAFNNNNSNNNSSSSGMNAYRYGNIPSEVSKKQQQPPAAYGDFVVTGRSV